MPKTVSIAKLRKQLAAQESQLVKLKKTRVKAAKQLAALDQKIAAIGGKAAPKKKTASKAKKARKMPKNTKPLVDFVADVLAGSKGMRVKEVAAAVKKAGYKTNSKDFYGIVATTLRDPKFPKVSRGVYTVKAAKKAVAKKKAVKKTAKKVAKKAATKKAPKKRVGKKAK